MAETANGEVENVRMVMDWSLYSQISKTYLGKLGLLVNFFI